MKKLVLFLLCGFAAIATFGFGESEEVLLDSFEYGGVDALEISRGSIYSVEVSAHAASSVRVEVYAPRDTRRVVHHRRDGGSVRIWTVNRFRLFVSRIRGSHRMVISAPRTCLLDISTDTGSISVRPIDGPKQLETDTGAVSVQGASGDITVETDTGDVRLETTRGHLEIKTDTGSIAVDDHIGDIAARSDTGEIIATGLELRGDAELETDTGDIHLKMAGALDGFTFDIATDTGSIAVGSTKARGKLVMGEGALKVRVRTDTGSVRIE